MQNLTNAQSPEPAEDIVDSDLLRLVSQIRVDLFNRVDFNVFALDVSKSTERVKTLTTWANMLGIVALDLYDSVMLLLEQSRDGSHRRAAIVVLRVLLEYWVRLEFYGINPDDAEKDMAEIKGHIGRFFKHTMDLADLSDDEREHFKQYVEAANPKNPRVDGMLQAVRPEQWKRLYYNDYGYACAIVHGNPMLIKDTFRAEYNEAGDLDNSRSSMMMHNWRFSDQDLYLRLGDAGMCLLRAVEKLSGRGNASTVLEREWKPISDRIVAARKALDGQRA